MIPIQINKLLNRFITLWLDEQGNFAGISFHLRSSKKCSMAVKMGRYKTIKQYLKNRK